VEGRMKDLRCLACGAPLPNSGECPYCGTIHESDGSLLVEHYARCPKCKRNDQIRAVSLIDEEKAIDLGIPLRPVHPDDDPPFLESPIDTSLTEGSRGCLLIAFIGFVFLSLSGSFEGFQIFFVLGIIILVIYMGIYLNKLNENARKNDEMKHQYQKELVQYQKNLETYPKRLDEYKNTYYCFRDGTVFTYRPKT
jgi:hypothetical protein